MSQRDQGRAGAQSPLGPIESAGPSAAEVVRHEEQLVITKTAHEVGAVRARKVVEARPVKEVVQRSTEHADVERAGPNEDDSGRIETLEDGSISIPIFEEEVVVSKRTVVRERIVIRKGEVPEARRVEAELRRERVEVDSDPGAVDRS